MRILMPGWFTAEVCKSHSAEQSVGDVIDYWYKSVLILVVLWLLVYNSNLHSDGYARRIGQMCQSVDRICFYEWKCVSVVSNDKLTELLLE